MRRPVSLITLLFWLFPLVMPAQYGGRQGATSGASGGTTTPEEDPATATLKHAIAVQATREQIAQFPVMIKSTEAARQQAHDVQHLSSDASDALELTQKATGLQNWVAEAQNETRDFRRSLSDSQEAGLKRLTKKLTKADSAVGKGAQAISQQMEQGPLNPARLASAAATLEKALAGLQSDQLKLGKEMGIPSH